MFSCNLPSALLAEWPESFACYCGNTGVERNKSQHRKSSCPREKKILPPLLQGFEPATFQSRVRRSNHWAIPSLIGRRNASSPVSPNQLQGFSPRPAIRYHLQFNEIKYVSDHWTSATDIFVCWHRGGVVSSSCDSLATVLYCSQQAKGINLSLAGAAVSVIFVETKVLSRQTHGGSGQNTSFVTTKVCLLRQNYVWRDKFWQACKHAKIMFVCRDKTFVATKIFCRDKDVFCPDKTFIATKIILAAAPANHTDQL